MRRPGLAGQRPSADAGPAAPLGAALIIYMAQFGSAALTFAYVRLSTIEQPYKLSQQTLDVAPQLGDSYCVGVEGGMRA